MNKHKNNKTIKKENMQDIQKTIEEDNRDIKKEIAEPKKGSSRLNQKLSWILLGKKVILSNNVVLICPRCSSRMRKISKSEVNIDSCSYCGGLWLDRGEIDKLIKLGIKSENENKNRLNLRKKKNKLIKKKKKQKY